MKPLGNFDPKEEMAYARSLIEFACKQCGVPQLSNQIELGWRNFRSAHGQAGPTKYGYYIHLSWPLWPHSPLEEKRNTIIHEACHCIHHFMKGSFQGKPHGSFWKFLMVKCGENPVRIFDLSTLQGYVAPARKRRSIKPKITLKCKCDNGCKFSAIQIKRMRYGVTYRCRFCHTSFNKNSLLTAPHLLL